VRPTPIKKPPKNPPKTRRGAPRAPNPHQKTPKKPPKNPPKTRRGASRAPNPHQKTPKNPTPPKPVGAHRVRPTPTKKPQKNQIP